MDRQKKRTAIQALAALVQNANFRGFFTGKIYSGPVKQICVPGLNCYSCPGAVGACPIGSLQSFLDSRPIRIPYYIVGLLLFFGALLGRAVCGFLCPMGFLQELVHKIPFPWKKKRFRGDAVLRKLKYVILVLMVLLPLAVPLVPFFCKYICPSGTIAGLFLAASNRMIRPALGALFRWKLAVLVGILLACLVIFRPFCRYLCPLGAIYGFFNRIALYGVTVDAEKCTHCGACAAACPMAVNPAETPDSPECIRCGTCSDRCPHGALCQSWRKPR